VRRESTREESAVTEIRGRCNGGRIVTSPPSAHYSPTTRLGYALRRPRFDIASTRGGRDAPHLDLSDFGPCAMIASGLGGGGGGARNVTSLERSTGNSPDGRGRPSRRSAKASPGRVPNSGSCADSRDTSRRAMPLAVPRKSWSPSLTTKYWKAGAHPGGAQLHLHRPLVGEAGGGLSCRPLCAGLCEGRGVRGGIR
jgi:hypothetical protein